MVAAYAEKDAAIVSIVSAALQPTAAVVFYSTQEAAAIKGNTGLICGGSSVHAEAAYGNRGTADRMTFLEASAPSMTVFGIRLLTVRSD